MYTRSLHPSPAPRKPLACVTISPLAFLKLQFFLHTGDTEIGGFGICKPDDLLYIVDFQTVKQITTAVTVEFDDQAVADHFDRSVDAGLSPQQFARVWIHTHPGESPEPSSVDEVTFARVFGSCDWACMFIMGRTGKTYARVRFSAGPSGSVMLPVIVDWAEWPEIMEDHQHNLPELLETWMDEYGTNVHCRGVLWSPSSSTTHSPASSLVDSLLQTNGMEPLRDPMIEQYRQELLEEELIAAYEASWPEDNYDYRTA